MRDKLLIKFAEFHSRHPWIMLTIVAVLTIFFLILSTQLQVAMRWSDLLPENDPRTVQFNNIIKEFKSSTSIVVVVQGEEERIKEFAEYIAPQIVALKDTTKNSAIKNKITKLEKRLSKSPGDSKIIEQIESLRTQISAPLVQRVDYKQEIEFIKNHGLMLVKEDDLNNTRELYTNPNLSAFLENLNNSLEKEYVGKSESISSREKEDQAFFFLDGLKELLSTLKRSVEGGEISSDEIQTTVDKFLIGDPYFISYDKTALILNVVPSFPMTDADKMVVGTQMVQAIVDNALKDYPDLTAGLSGMIAIGHDEMIYTEKSLGYTSLFAFIAILLLLIFSFRMWLAPIMAMINLLIGVLWAIGVTVIFVGQLNFMTSMMTVILFGLGIDFSIHIISAFTEHRALGHPIYDSLKETFLKSAKGVITGAMTTAFAFLTPVISSSRGMKEMGLVTGLGLIAILCATLMLLPTLLVLRERRLEKRKSKSRPPQDISLEVLGKAGERLGSKYPMTLSAAVIVTLLLAFFGSKLTFDYNYMNIEPKGLVSIALQDTILTKFDMGMDYALILTDDIEESRELAKEYRKMNSVAATEDISLYLPAIEDQLKRKAVIEDIRSHLEKAIPRTAVNASELNQIISQLDRLEMNIMEIQDMAYIGGQDKVDNKCKEIVGDPEADSARSLLSEIIEKIRSDKQESMYSLSNFQREFAPYFKASVLTMANTKLIKFEDLPESILDRYANDRRDKFLVTVFPAGNIWQDARFLHRFVDDLESKSNKVTGMPPVFRALIQVIGKDGRNAVYLTLVIVFIFLWIDFGSYREALLAMIPLGVGITWMVGLMYLTGQQLTALNFMGLPMIVGIGIDDGVHIIHRWQSEGKHKLHIIFSSTGKAILLTSLTTMIAFGSLIFSIYRGFGQLGSALFVGVGACFLATVIILPAIIYWVDKRSR